jgi:hypothetical protein
VAVSEPGPGLHVGVIDIGRRENIGWAIEGPKISQGKSLDDCVDALAEALNDGPLALGFEAPMFVPLHEDATNLTRGRKGERDRAYTAPAGSAVLVSALVVVPYVLQKLRALVPHATATFDWIAPLDVRGRLLLFEAFVSHQAKSDADPHIRDAKLAIARFREGIRNPSALQSAIEEPACLNLLGGILIRTGWTNDLTVLRQSCLVVRQRGS